MDSEKSVNNYDTNETEVDPDYDDYSNPDPTTYYRNISLRCFAAQPLRMLCDHIKLKELCLQNGNSEAQYIEGILQYFVNKNKQLGLIHLRESATGNNPNGMYLYGVLRLAEGHYRSGTKYLDKIQWKENRTTSDQCWERIKNSLSGINVTMKEQYYVNMVNFKPRSKCDLENMAIVCTKCYYFKRLSQFVEFVGNKE